MKIKVFFTAREYDGNSKKICVETDAKEEIVKCIPDFSIALPDDIFAIHRNVLKALWTFCEGYAMLQGYQDILRINKVLVADEYKSYKAEEDDE